MTRKALVLALIGVVPVAAVPAQADEQVLHRVTYTVTSDVSFRAHIYYRDVDPPNWADYSHDPYRYSPRIEADLAPGRPWTREVMLADPDQWAMVVATSGQVQTAADLHCELSVDGVVTVTRGGPKGALCSVRQW